MKKLMPAQYSWTVLSRSSLENLLRLTNNWLMETELIPTGLRKLSSYQVEKLITSITANYVVDKNNLFAYYFENITFSVVVLKVSAVLKVANCC